MIALAQRWPALTAAVEAAPREVAGWIAADAVHVLGAFAPDRFGLDDDALVALVRASRGAYPPLALFHSHPDGRAALSPADRAAWAPTGVPLHAWPQLVIATRGGRACAAALFAWRDGDDGPIALATYRRADDGGWA